MKLTDANGNLIVENENLFSGCSESGIDPVGVAERVSASFIFTG